MLLSMTGFGEARHQSDTMSIGVEIRSVNNRHLKLTCRVNSAYDALEPDLERLVRNVVRRGTVQLTVRVDRPRREEDYRLNTVALRSYLNQLGSLGVPNADSINPALLVTLPGVVEEQRDLARDPHADWPLLEATTQQAIDQFQAARRREGRAMADELLALGRSFADQLERIVERLPAVVTEYHARLLERVQTLLKDRVGVEPKDLIREVAILADRADVSEEITRLRAHLEQYVEVIEAPESAGRKLEFLVQEMNRETNTLGAKANDIAISRGVVELKSLLERIRELIQNVE